MKRSLFVLGCSVALLLYGCANLTSKGGGDNAATGKGGGKGKGKRGDAAVPVTVAKVRTMEVPVEIQVIGTVEPYSTVMLKAQVGGEIRSVHFREGDSVKSGDLLFTIDPRTLDAEVRRIEANLARDQAVLKQGEANLNRDLGQESNARTQAERYDKLTREGVISKEMNDNVQSNAKALAEAVKASRASLESIKAQIDANRAALDAQKILLSYTKVYSPVSGRTGAILSKPGNIVTPNVTELVSINQVQPVYVSFAVPEAHLASIRRHAGKRLPVYATPDDGADLKQNGALTFIDNAVDVSTGTIRLKATFANSANALWPGQFVRVVLQLERRANSIVIPNQAVQSGQEGQFVYVISERNTAEVRPVTVGARVAEDMVIEKGLAVEETIVTDGHLRLSPGARIQIREGGRGPGGGKKKQQPSE
ncbi:MAG: efflux RND transporter periplasmic adaptor subunit [Bryobacterales bacterium]|nr:efflux RND transporter periplasmic adaptor subunit [Bryobacterales bacterium]